MNPATTPTPVFVYGTLRTGQGNYAWLLRGNTAREVPARLPGFELYAAGIPFIFPAEGGSVRGDLMFLDPATAEATMSGLDRLEGYNPDSDRHSSYERVLVTVVTDEGETHEAWAYKGNESIRQRLRSQGGEPAADGDWLTARRAPSKRVLA